MRESRPSYRWSWRCWGAPGRERARWSFPVGSTPRCCRPPFRWRKQQVWTATSTLLSTFARSLQTGRWDPPDRRAEEKKTSCWVVFHPCWTVGDRQGQMIGVCYHHFLPPDGKIPLPHCQNNVWKEGRALNCIHHPVVDSKAAGGLGACSRGSALGNQLWGYLPLLSVLEAELCFDVVG